MPGPCGSGDQPGGHDADHRLPTQLAGSPPLAGLVGRFLAVDVRCRLQLVGDQPVVSVDGAIDVATMPQLRDELLRAVHRCRGQLVVVDLDGVSVLDDTGLGVLLAAAAAARHGGGDLELVCSTAGLIARFAITGLDRAIIVRARLTP